MVIFFSDHNVVSHDYNQVSSWWQKTRDSLIDSNNLSSALLLALVCRSVCVELGKAEMVVVIF